MKLTEDHRKVIRRILAKLPECTGSECYLCLLLFGAADDLARNEKNVWYRFFVPGRSARINSHWEAIRQELSDAIKKGIRYEHTLGIWYEEQARQYGVEVGNLATGNNGLYTMIRMAWLERALYTGELK